MQPAVRDRSCGQPVAHLVQSGNLERTLNLNRGVERQRFAYAHNPLDVVGWDGCVYPFAFPITRFQPRVSSVHLPPTWHGTFAARGALVRRGQRAAQHARRRGKLRRVRRVQALHGYEPLAAVALAGLGQGILGALLDLVARRSGAPPSGRLEPASEAAE